MARKLGLKTTGVQKALRYARLYSADVSKNKATTSGSGQSCKKRSTAAVPKLRPSIVPGTILILVGGPFRGKRVVFLKQLDSGSLLVTGPHKLNGVPFARVQQSLVIATSTRIDISEVKIPEDINDATFKQTKCKKEAFIPEKMDIDESSAKKANTECHPAQKSVDSALIAVIKQTPMLAAYLRSPFSLSKGQAPHAMCF